MRASTLRALGLVVACCLSLAGAVHYVNLTIDDAFISFRYAENLAHGRGLVFNPGERVEGFSNPLFTLLLALPASLGVGRYELGMLWTGKIFTALCGLTTLVVVTRSQPPPRSALAALPLGALFLASSAVHLLWSVGALEGPLLGLLLVLSASAWLREMAQAPSPTRCDWSALWLALAALTRPEPVVLIAPLFGLRVATWPTRDRRALRAHARYLLTFALPCLAYFLFRLGYYGRPLPNTYYAKLHHDGSAWARGLSYADEGLQGTNLTAIALASILLALLARVEGRRVLVVVLLCATQLAAIVYEGGDWMRAFRLLAPALSLVALLVDSGLRAALRLELAHLALPPLPSWVVKPGWVERYNARLAQSGDRARWLVRATALLALVACLALGSARSYAAWIGERGSGFDGIHPGQGELFDVARWMTRHCEPGALLATGEGGIVPYYTGMPLLDLNGLMDPYVASLPGGRHRKFDLGYVLGKRPKYVFLLVTLQPDGQETSTSLYSRQLLASSRFHAQYQLLQRFPNSAVYGRRAP